MSSIPGDSAGLVELLSTNTPPLGVRIVLLQKDTPPGRHKNDRHIEVGLRWVGLGAAGRVVGAWMDGWLVDWVGGCVGVWGVNEWVSKDAAVACKAWKPTSRKGE